MNYLAHIYLSGNNTELKIGNFIADSVKGKKIKLFSPKVQKGIILHRKIDFFTDHHDIVKSSIQRLKPTYGLYSGVIIDIFYDHFLAANWTSYSDIPLDIYVSNFYDLLLKQHHFLPERVQKFLPFMIKDNWLLSYATIPGISKILHQMNLRTKNKSKMHFAVIELETFYTDFEREFHCFFEELIIFAKQEVRTLE